MTNNEFIDLLVVTGKLDIGKLERDQIALECLDKIREYPKYIGDIYFKLLNLDEMKLIEVLRTIAIIIIEFDLDHEEMEIVVKRFEYVHNIMDKGYVYQIVNLFVQLRDAKRLELEGVERFDKKEVLYKCRLNIPSNESEYFNKKGKNKYHILFGEKIAVQDMIHRVVLCRDLEYIIINDGWLEFIERGKEDLERDKYKYRVTYWRGKKNG